MADAIAELLATDAARVKLGARGISTANRSISKQENQQLISSGASPPASAAVLLRRVADEAERRPARHDAEDLRRVQPERVPAEGGPRPLVGGGPPPPPAPA